MSAKKDTVYTLLDYGVAKARDGLPPGAGISVEATFQGDTIKFSQILPPARGGKPFTRFDYQKAVAVATRNSTILKMATEGGKLHIWGDRHPGDEITAQLKDAGMRWDGARKRWVEP